ncbi:insulin receptor substrate 2-B-like [Salvelinus fontinalis]|uniref:insulin receptor substrate 2-B-like n=1 Tax=Salvelinus fontinalis TaxID=8038 RepID=UPI002486B283|nr:insulin receptor substrate 2-B-like [Salvelinus fontinalis]
MDLGNVSHSCDSRALKVTTSTTSSSSPPPSSSLSSSAHRQLEAALPPPLQVLQLKRHHKQYYSHGHNLLPKKNPLDNTVRELSSSCVYEVPDSGGVPHDPTASASAMALAVTTTVCSGVEARDVWKSGYLRKMKHSHKRFFVLRGPSDTGPSRLEYYDSEKKFRNGMKSVCKSPSAVGSPKKVIYLYQCFTVSKRVDSKHKHLIALYTKDEHFVMIAENEEEQEDWYLALSDLVIQEKKEYRDAEELDDGYWTISPGAIFKEVWQVIVKPKGLGQTKNLIGVCRLCLSAKTIHLVKMCSEMTSVNLPLMNVRRCGHSESFFFMEVGRSSSTGPGEIWMQVESGDPVVAQNMHETILEAMRALRAIPDFRPRSKSQSFPSNPCAVVTTRRQHHGNLPPSLTGLQRSIRVETVVSKPSPQKNKGDGGHSPNRTSSHGEGTVNQLISPGTGTLALRNVCISKSLEESLSHCACISTTISVSSSSGNDSDTHPWPSDTSVFGSSSDRGSDTHPWPSDTSVFGSSSDRGSVCAEDLCSNPCVFQLSRSNTPDSLFNTTLIDENSLTDYVSMDLQVTAVAGTNQGDRCDVETSKPEHSRQYHQTTSCTPKCENYLSSKRPFLHIYNQSKLPVVESYMPMTCAPGRHYTDDIPSDYNVTPTPLQTPSATMFPSDQLGPQGYMIMLPRSCSPAKDSLSDVDHLVCDEYMNMSLGSHMDGHTHGSPEALKSYSSYSSLPSSNQPPSQRNCEHDDYVSMCHPAAHHCSADEWNSRNPLCSSPRHSSHPSSDVLLNLSDVPVLNVTGLSLDQHGVEDSDLPTQTESIQISTDRLNYIALYLRDDQCSTCDVPLHTDEVTSPLPARTSPRESGSGPGLYTGIDLPTSAGQTAATRRWLCSCLPLCINTDDSE